MNNRLQELEELYLRDLGRLQSNLEETSEDHLWASTGGVTNSCGVLTQHLVGNLQHFIGAALGDTGYQRDRDMEFTKTGKTKAELIDDVENTKKMITDVFKQLDEEALSSAYPMKIPHDYSVYQFLLHLYGHLSYHMGQINYLRRILDANKS